MQPETNVIPFSIIPRKPADRETIYNCPKCDSTIWLSEQTLMNLIRRHTAVYCTNCPFGAEMRPVEGE